MISIAWHLVSLAVVILFLVSIWQAMVATHRKDRPGELTAISQAVVLLGLIFTLFAFRQVIS